jgi:hypothetical protein
METFFIERIGASETVVTVSFEGLIKKLFNFIHSWSTEVIEKGHGILTGHSRQLVALFCTRARPSDFIIDCKAKHHDSHSLHSQEVYRLMIRLSMNSTVAVSLLLIGGTGAVAEVSKVLASRAEN